MSDNDAVLFANEAFYQAFSERDIEAMDGVWAAGVPVACLHPGWEPLTGRDRVMQSWLSILANPDSPKVICYDAQAHLLGEAAYVICLEEIAGQFLAATNIFVRQQSPHGKIWRIAHHQSGPTAGQPSGKITPEVAVN